MAKTKYLIKLSESERNLLTQIVCEGKEPDKKIMRAKILLMSDFRNGTKQSVRALAEQLGTTDTTIQTVRTEYATEGLETTLSGHRGRPRGHYKRFGPDVVLAIKELAKEEPPAGHKRWSSRTLCAEAVARGIVDHIVPSTVLQILSEEEPADK